MHELNGRVAVVTGAASGIGLALAERFLAEGMRVVMSDVDGARLEESASRLEGDVEGVAADVSKWEDVEDLARRARDRFGAVDVLCNNAGVTRPGLAWEIELDEWEWLIGVNLRGVIHGIRAFVPQMIERGEAGHVVNTASISGLLPFPSVAPYSASKYGVVGLSETLYHDLRGEGAPIGVSVLVPGPIATDFRSHSRALHPVGGQEDVPGEYAGVDRMPPSDVAGMVVNAIRDDRFWVLTHPEMYRDAIEQRTRGIVETDELVVGFV
jgi:NAD(P)-dependent dehydrogenase (short-subunit alcohol dehydrogenase family)